MAGRRHPFHVYALGDGWAFDFSGWNCEPELLRVNADFEGRALERVAISVSLAEFCRDHLHRLPHQYWDDPVPRARDYVSRYQPPWVV